MLEATILMDNIAMEDYVSEHGFCVLINYNGKKFLLDTGSTNKYIKNVEKMDINLADVDCAVLSHAHYDHSGGYKEFFKNNKKAKLFVSNNCRENCYHKKGMISVYIGLPKGILDKYNDRIEYVYGFREISQGVYLVPHLDNGLEIIGKKNNMYRKMEGKLIPDNFSHEQSLVFETEKGLVIFNSCSHAGLENIIKDVNFFLPGKHVYMTVGGLHLMRSKEKKVRETANTIKGLAIDKIMTGHCTGSPAYAILKETLGDRACQTKAGMKVVIDESV